MPELYGNEFKHVIRAERDSLSQELNQEKVAHYKTRQALRMTRAKCAELEAQIERMKQILQGAIAEADSDIGPAVVQRYTDDLKINRKLPVEAN